MLRQRTAAADRDTTESSDVRLLLRAEAVWWMMRPNFYMPAVATLATWLATSQQPLQWQSGVLAALGVALLSGGMQIANDVFDQRADRITAPHLPLPAGLLSPLHGRVLALAALALAACFIALSSPGDLFASLGVLLGVALLGTLYSRAKRWTFLATLLASLAYAALCILGWIAGGKVTSATLYVYVFDVWGVAFYGNTLASIRDIDLDLHAGNDTPATRYGPRKAITLALLPWVASFAVTLFWATANHVGSLGVSLLLLPALVAPPTIARAVRRLEKGPTGRSARAAQLNPLFLLNFGRQVALVALAAPELGWVLILLLLALHRISTRAYQRRIVEGRLAMALGA